MKNHRFFSSDTGVLLIAILLQVLILRISHLSLAAATCVVLIVFSLFFSKRRRGIIAIFMSIAILTVPALLVRVLTGDNRLSEMITWSAYYLRLVSAALTARLFLLIRGTSGIQRGFVGLVSFLPGTLPLVIGSLVGNSLFLVPVVLVHIRRTFQISRIRYSGRSGDSIRVIPRVLCAIFASLSVLPVQRAEGMVIRGLVR